MMFNQSNSVKTITCIYDSSRQCNVVNMACDTCQYNCLNPCNGKIIDIEDMGRPQSKIKPSGKTKLLSSSGNNSTDIEYKTRDVIDLNLEIASVESSIILESETCATMHNIVELEAETIYTDACVLDVDSPNNMQDTIIDSEPVVTIKQIISWSKNTILYYYHYIQSYLFKPETVLEKAETTSEIETNNVNWVAIIKLEYLKNIFSAIENFYTTFFYQINFDFYRILLLSLATISIMPYTLNLTLLRNNILL